MTGERPPADRARLAAGNNADLYEIVFRAHGLEFARDGTMFASHADPPPYYGNVTTLAPGETRRQMAAVRRLRLARKGPLGVKDGFCELDLATEGFEILFQASWVWAPAERLGCSTPAGWEQVETPGALAAWQEAWKASGSPTERDVFLPRLLADNRAGVFGRRRDAGYDAGCILNRSAECVGLSNLFGPTPQDAPYSEVSSLAARIGDAGQVVGYDRGAALSGLLACGFEEVGPLRVWVSDGAAEPIASAGRSGIEHRT